MAGHSKWANIRFRKGAQDAKRGKLFTKFIREITVAAREGGADTDSNPRLRAAVDKALAGNMTKDTINRAIARGAGGQDGADMDAIRYEGYGPNGVAVMADCLTDNRNRTVAEVRHAFTKCGGNLGTDGSVAYLFSQQGVLRVAAGADEEAVMEAALGAGADDMDALDDGAFSIATSTESFAVVRDALQAMGCQLEQAEVTWVASTTVSLDKEQAEKLLKLQDMLEDLDDVQSVYVNADIDDTILEQISGS